MLQAPEWPCRDCKFNLFLRVRRSQTCWAGWKRQQVELLALTSQTRAMRKRGIFSLSESPRVRHGPAAKRKKNAGFSHSIQWGHCNGAVYSPPQSEWTFSAAWCNVIRQHTVYLVNNEAGEIYCHDYVWCFVIWKCIYLFIHSALYTSRKLCCDASGCHQLTYVCLSLRSGLASWLNVSPRHVCILIWINLNGPHHCEEEFMQLLWLIWGSSEKILNIMPYMV